MHSVEASFGYLIFQEGCLARSTRLVNCIGHRRNRSFRRHRDSDKTQRRRMDLVFIGVLALGFP